MALQFDRVKETTTVTGTGNATLLGAKANFIAFSAAYTASSTSSLTAVIVDNINNAWEISSGTFTLSGNTYSRDIVLASSNAGALVNFAVGTKDVFITITASSAAWLILKITLDAGEVVIMPDNYRMTINGDFTLNASTGDFYMYKLGEVVLNYV